MAYRWRDGRLMSDEEVCHDDRATWDAVVHVGAAAILPLALGSLGNLWAGKFTMLVGVGVGAWLTHAFYGLLVRIWRAMIVLGIILGVMAVLAYLLRVTWGML